ncbi:MAG: hypothetical protein H0T78_05885 [Longispora sp.]|nr:hypothetical protein [Longispora sp. (in: high G+C Gram-positive bacteria)]
MTPKRGERVAPPAVSGEYTLRFANTDAVKGWEELCRQAPTNTRAAYEALRSDPTPHPAHERHHRLKFDLKWGKHDGKVLEQWQHEVTGGGRIWYLVDPDTHTVWLTYVGTGHPKATDR